MNINNEHENYLNPKIMEGNPTKNDQYHDLPGHLNEMLKGITDETDKELIIQNINSYYDSLNTLLIKHTIEHSRRSES